MQYLELVFSIEDAEEWKLDLLMQALGDIGFDSFETLDQGLKAYVPEHNFNLSDLEGTLDYFPYPMQLTYTIKEVPNENWNTRWEENFQAVVLADQIYIRAPFHAPRPDLPWEVIIHPKMAFGTGHHQTTALMLEYIAEIQPKGLQVLDMGAGTGILSILSAKMGAKHIWALDYDPICYESIQENTELNQVRGVEAKLGSSADIPQEAFDLILANINRNILLEQIPAYRKVLKPGGLLLLSGFYEGEDLDIIKTEAAVHGLHYINHKTQDNWVAAKFKL